MDNDGSGAAPDQQPIDDNNLAAGAGLPGGEGGDENVDQYFDDGGETFLPADHVSRSLILSAQRFEWE